MCEKCYNYIILSVVILSLSSCHKWGREPAYLNVYNPLDTLMVQYYEFSYPVSMSDENIVYHIDTMYPGDFLQCVFTYVWHDFATGTDYKYNSNKNDVIIQKIGGHEKYYIFYMYDVIINDNLYSLRSLENDNKFPLGNVINEIVIQDPTKIDVVNDNEMHQFVTDRYLGINEYDKLKVASIKIE